MCMRVCGRLYVGVWVREHAGVHASERVGVRESVKYGPAVNACVLISAQRVQNKHVQLMPPVLPPWCSLEYILEFDFVL